jgi:signal transduction histidine kinase/CheY-like chemotaxis protein
MPIPNTLSAALSSLRLDEIGFASIALSATWLFQQKLRRQYRMPRLPRRTLLAVTVTIAAAIAGSEMALAAGGVDHAAAIELRAVILLICALAIALALRDAGQTARFRDRLRAHFVAQRALESAKRAAEQASRAKSEFLVHTSHEIRTSLNAILASAEAFSRNAADTAQHNHAAVIAEEGMRLGSVLNEVLDLREIEEGRLILDRTPFAPGDIAREVVRLFEARAHQKGVALDLEAALPARFTMDGDPRRFRQVLINLLDNALRCTRHGSVAVRLCHSSPSPTTALLEVRVRDTGRGMPPESLRDVLHPFDGSGPATGLGISQRIVMLMGSSIVGRSEPGRGSEFSFTLAVEPAEDTTTAAVHTSPARARVLVVDDMEANRVMLEMFLDQHGFAVDHASGGAEAVERAQVTRYDAILMDITMPGMDGCAATRRIRANEPPGERALIVAVTACIGEEARARCLAAGMDEYFAKPLELRKFCRTLEQMIASGRSGAAGETPAAAEPAFSEAAALPSSRIG